MQCRREGVKENSEILGKSRIGQLLSETVREGVTSLRIRTKGTMDMATSVPQLGIK